MGKKAIFYTTAAIALSIVIIVTYSAYTANRLSERMDAVETRIETVNFFIKDFERDIGKVTFISGTRVFFSFNDFIVDKNTFLDDVNKRFRESFINGTINNTFSSIMKNSTFTDWINKISAEAGKSDIKLNFTVNDIKLNQTDPWSVLVGLNLSLDIRDKRNTSYWIRDRYFTAKISIIGLQDPLYAYNANGKLNNTIVKSNITNFVVSKNVANLMIHANNSYYIAHNDSPSFLMRLEGNFGNSTFGIESLVNVVNYTNKGFADKGRSVVDYIYFGTQSTTDYRINKTPEWFKLDSGHLDVYQVSNMTCAPAQCVTS